MKSSPDKIISQDDVLEMNDVKRVAGVFILLITLFLCSAYSNTFSSPVVLDDFHTFVFEENVQSKELSLTTFVALSRTIFGLQRWIPMLSFSLDLKIGGGEIFFFHLTNLIIHILCTLAVLFMIFNLCQVEIAGGRDYTVSPIYYAIWVAGLWALNPVQTNAVTYLVQRMASIQAFFFVSTVAFYLLGRRWQVHHVNGRKALSCYLACFISAIGAFLSKENSAMLPVMLLVTEIWFFSPDLPCSAWRRLKTAPWRAWGLLAVGALGASLYCVKVFQDLMVGYGIRHFTLGERLLTEARIVIWYISLLLWPAPSRLSLEHDVLVSSSLLNPPTTLLAIILIAFCGWMILRYRKRFPLITFGGLWFFLNLVIESTIVPLELVFEHRLYLPSVGFSVVVVCSSVGGLNYLLANRAAKDRLVLISCGFAMVFSGLTLLTFSRNEAWRNSISIYRDAAQKAPDNPRAHANLAVAYGRAGLYNESIDEARLALKVGRERNEQYLVAANAIVSSLVMDETFEDAITEARDLLENSPKQLDGGALPVFCLNWALAHLKLGQLSDAYSVAMKAFPYLHLRRESVKETRLLEAMLLDILRSAANQEIDLNQDGINDPGEFSINSWIAKEFLQHDERHEAKKLLMLATLENSEDVKARQLLEMINREDDLNNAQMDRENIRQTYQSSPFTRFNASMALAHLIRTPNRSATLLGIGEKLLDYAIEVQPGAADAHLLKAYYLHDRKEIEPAIAATERALALDPNYAKAWLALGFFQMELNQFQTAVTAFRKGLELYPGCPQRQSVLAAITAIEQNPALSTAQN